MREDDIMADTSWRDDGVYLCVCTYLASLLCQAQTALPPAGGTSTAVEWHKEMISSVIS